MKILELELPQHWASALFNGDLSGYEENEVEAIERLVADMVAEHGQCWAVNMADEYTNFRRYHDANCYGIFASDVATYQFDITPRT